MCLGEGVTHDPQRIQGLVGRGRPGTVGELIQFLQAANSMRTHLPEFVEAKARLQAEMDEWLPGLRRKR